MRVFIPYGRNIPVHSEIFKRNEEMANNYNCYLTLKCINHPNEKCEVSVNTEDRLAFKVETYCCESFKKVVEADIKVLRKLSREE
ncbi:hypothetical protein BH09BAC2_BH09BAC2_22320 [soil metagenome]